MKLKNSTILRLSLNSLVLIFLISSVSCQKLDPDAIIWEEEKIEKGLIWKHAHTDKLFESWQNINILEIDIRKRSITLVYNREKNVITSKLAQDTKAIAAVNAGFFDMENGGSVTYIKVDGETRLEDTIKWRLTKTLNGAMITKSDGRIDVEPAGEYAQYTSNEKYDDVLVTGCLLIDEGNRIPMPDVSFVNKRHPRTCLGIMSEHKILLITVDGRSDQAHGMSLHELADFLEMLGCIEAINLDGGGSTTMWIKDFEEIGVVNMPSDNKQFDHGGERAVSNILVVQ
jgi:exopolysaccharide biosynthesis protein